MLGSICQTLSERSGWESLHPLLSGVAVHAQPQSCLLQQGLRASAATSLLHLGTITLR